MKLDMDLFRNILLFLEDQPYYQEDSQENIEPIPVTIEKIYENFPKQNKEDIYYTLKNLEQAQFINASSRFSGDVLYTYDINYITFLGHEFIAAIKNDNRWSGIKKALPVIKNFSLEAIQALSQGMTSAAINAYFQTNP